MKYRFHLIFFVLISFVFFLCHPADLRAQAWSNLGLYGGQVYDIAIDPSDPDKMFAGSYMGDGLFVTTDGGAHWQAVETGGYVEGEDTFKNHAVWAVKIAPSDPDVVWAAHNYWVEKSTDGGQSWHHILNRTMQRDCASCGGIDDSFRFCRCVAVDPADPEMVYVGTGGPSGGYASGAVYKTVDGGITWNKLNQGEDFDHTVMDIAIDPQNRNRVWAATSSFGAGNVWAGTLYLSRDGGENWETIFTLDSGFTSVAVDPGDSQRVFTTSGYGVVEHDFDGTQWQSRFGVISNCYVAEQVCFDPQDPEVMYAVWLTPVSWGGDGIGKIARSNDGGSTWQIYSHGLDFMSIAVHPVQSGELFAGDRSLGIFRSPDQGQSWTPVNEGVNAVIVYDLAVDPNDSAHLIAGTQSGLYERANEQSGWSRLLSDQITDLAWDPADSRTFYAGMWGWLAKTQDGGANWSYTGFDITNHPVEAIAIDPLDTDTVFLALGTEIRKSPDGGASFETVLDEVNQYEQPYVFNAIAIDPTDGEHVFAGGGNFYAPKVLGELWESTDGGLNWTLTGLTDVIVNALLIDPRNPDMVYAGCGYSGGAQVPVYKSADGGNTWSASHEGIPPGIKILMSIWGSGATEVFSAGKCGTVTNAPVYRYNGTTWNTTDSGVNQDLVGLWGDSGADVFAVGTAGTILHYDGQVWHNMAGNTAENLNGVWGSSASDVFAVGESGTVMHYDGSTWTAMNSNTTENLAEVWGVSASDVFAVGENGTVMHYDGSAWSAMNSSVADSLYDVWGSSASDVFAVGENGRIVHYNGTSWSAMASPVSKPLNALWGASAADIFAVGVDGIILHYDGSAWIETGLATTENLMDVWGESADEVFAVGNLGSIVHYDGNGWTVMQAGGRNYNAVTDLEFHRETTRAVYASTLGTGVYVSPNQGEQWLNLGAPEQDVFAISTSSVYAGTQAGVLKCTGTGVIAGMLTDPVTQTAIDGATIFTDLGVKTRSINGEYMMVSPAGNFSVTVVKENYANTCMQDVTVNGGDVCWVDMDMAAGLADRSAMEAGSSAEDGSSASSATCFIRTLAR